MLWIWTELYTIFIEITVADTDFIIRIEASYIDVLLCTT